MKSPVNTSTTNNKLSFTLALWLGLASITGLSGCGSSSSSDPTVSIAGASVTEGDTDMVFTVTASKSSKSVITVTYATSDGTATAGSDYTAITSDSVNIQAGDTSTTITVPITGDSDIEDDETFTLTLTAASGATLGTATATGTIVNDDEDPKGYYDSASATVKQADDLTDRNISDLLGMVSGNRFILMSVSEVLLYDGTITSKDGSSYTATVDIYEDGVLLAGSVAATGTMTTASSFTVNLTGTGAGNGSFALTYSMNNADSALSRIDVVDGWSGPLNGAPNDIFTTYISDTGEFSRSHSGFPSITPVIGDCEANSGGTVLPILDVNVYAVTLKLSACTDPLVDGDYTGFATTQTVADDVLVLTFTNGSYSASGVLPLD
jgi:hypothetical protein